jgi:Flp pilus assembly protein TadG
MEPVLSYLSMLVRALHGRLRELRRDERGSLTLEQVVIASVLFIAALALVGVIVAVIKSYQGKITAPGGQ